MMKKLMLIFATVLFTVAGLSAAEQGNEAKNSRPFTYFSLGILPGVPNSTQLYNVRGLKLGIPVVNGTGYVRGIEASVLYSGTYEIEGCQASLVGPVIARSIMGVQASMGPAICKDFSGFQASGGAVCIRNAMGCQAGIATVAHNFTGFQTGAVNVVTNELTGFQFGAVNIANNRYHGFQCGAFNFVTGAFKGFQCGVFNFSSRDGIQLGGINVIANGYLPVTILFNYSFRD